MGEKICCDFAHPLPSSISGTRSRAMRRWKAHDEKCHPTVFVFSFSLIEGFASRFCCFWLDWKKQFALQFLVPPSIKIRENTRALLDDGFNFNFYPKKEKPRFLSFSGCSAEGAPIERFVLSSASHWCAGCWGFLHTIFSRLELFLLPLYERTNGAAGGGRRPDWESSILQYCNT